MKCEYCDNMIPANSVVCPHCGAQCQNNKKVVRVVTTNKPQKGEEDNSNKYINMFLYGIIILGIILIITIILIRFK